MGKGKKMKKYFLISGFSINDNNRGTAALGYGAIAFLYERGFLGEEQEIVSFRFLKNPFDKRWGKTFSNLINSGKRKWKCTLFYVPFYEKHLAIRWGILLPFTSFGRIMRNVSYVAAINGGDGFSDIYGTKTFYARLPETFVAMGLKLPLIEMPQTLGPFKERANYKEAKRILKYATKVYVRDEKFVSELEKGGIIYEKTKDLSAYMMPLPFDIKILPGAIGINVSGLAYFNAFQTFVGRFDKYPYLISEIVNYFQSIRKPIYLIPHSYNYNNPEINNDDLVACKEVYKGLEEKSGVCIIDRDMISPQVKFVISKMSFFIGTRMHANFAAIYTGVPVFGLSYSYKFLGAFEANGLNGDKQIGRIDDIDMEGANNVVRKIIDCYNLLVKRKR